MREKHKLRTLDDDGLEQLRNAKKTTKKEIKGVHNYEILSNLQYAASFQYQSIDLRNSEMDFQFSDMIAKVLYQSQYYEAFDNTMGGVANIIGAKF